MALIKCYECGKDISSLAPACPGCGAPKREDLKPEFSSNYQEDNNEKEESNSVRDRGKNDKELIANWLIEKDKTSNDGGFELAGEQRLSNKEDSKPNKSKREFSSRFVSALLYGIAGFLGGFGIARVPSGRSLEHGLASLIGMGMLFGLLFFVYGLFRDIKGGKRAILYGAFMCVLFKAGQFGGSYYGRIKGTEFAEEYSKREPKKEITSVIIPNGWFEHSFKEHNVTFAAPGYWGRIAEDEKYLWGRNAVHDATEFNVFFNVSDKEVFKKITPQEYINRPHMKDWQKMLDEDSSGNLELISINKEYMLGDKKALLIEMIEMVEGERYSRLSAQSLYNGKMYTLIVLVMENHRDLGVKTLRELAKTFQFSI